jgi:hypothetical protein
MRSSAKRDPRCGWADRHLPGTSRSTSIGRSAGSTSSSDRGCSPESVASARGDGRQGNAVDHRLGGAIDAMRAHVVGFGEIEVEGKRYDADVVIERGEVRRRHKKLSKPYRDRFGHTPLSAKESIPWDGPRLIVGTGADGRLPIMAEVYREAARRNVEIVALPTDAACRLVADLEPGEVNAVLHVTCYGSPGAADQPGER